MINSTKRMKKGKKKEEEKQEECKNKRKQIQHFIFSQLSNVSIAFYIKCEKAKKLTNVFLHR